LLEERPGIRALVMSGSDKNELKSQRLNLQFIPKPLDVLALLATVRTMLAAAH
jgi:hypothetical protein